MVQLAAAHAGRLAPCCGLGQLLAPHLGHQGAQRVLMQPLLRHLPQLDPAGTRKRSASAAGRRHGRARPRAPAHPAPSGGAGPAPAGVARRRTHAAARVRAPRCVVGPACLLGKWRLNSACLPCLLCMKICLLPRLFGILSAQCTADDWVGSDWQPARARAGRRPLGGRCQADAPLPPPLRRQPAGGHHPVGAQRGGWRPKSFQGGSNCRAFMGGGPEAQGG